MIAALCASLACALLLTALDSRELLVTGLVAFVWLAAAALVRAATVGRAVLMVTGAAIPFHAVAFAADLDAGAPLGGLISSLVLSLAWSGLLAAGASRAACAGRSALYLGLWTIAAWLGPALTLASSAAGERWEAVAWLNALSAPWWSLELTLAAAPGASNEFARALAPSVSVLVLLALARGAERSEGDARVD